MCTFNKDGKKKTVKFLYWSSRVIYLIIFTLNSRVCGV